MLHDVHKQFELIHLSVLLVNLFIKFSEAIVPNKGHMQ